jgi:hypothetical protein
MLGLGRASQYAGWWNQGGPAQVTMNSVASVNYAVEQTPSFSWLNVPDSSTTPIVGAPGRQALFAAGNINAANVSSQTGYNNNNWTTVCTFAIDYPTTGLVDNDGYKYDQKFQGDGSDFTSNMAWVIANDNVKLRINWPGVPSNDFPGSYTSYNGRWLTIVGSVSNDKANFAGWAGPAGTYNYYTRFLTVDTETGEQISLRDDAYDTRLSGLPADFATWISNASGNISTERSDAYSYSIGGGSSGYPEEYLRIANYWVSWGTMFDPLTVTDTSWRTTRPSSQFGNATAWLNCQFAEYGNTSGYAEVWSVTSGMDRFTPQTSPEQMDLIQYSGNSTVFNDLYSSTDKPISRG